MTVKELKEILNKYPDNVEVGFEHLKIKNAHFEKENNYLDLGGDSEYVSCAKQYEELMNKLSLIKNEYITCVNTAIDYAEQKDQGLSAYYSTLASGIKLGLVALNFHDF